MLILGAVFVLFVLFAPGGHRRRAPGADRAPGVTAAPLLLAGRRSSEASAR